MLQKGPIKIYWGDQEIEAQAIEVILETEYTDCDRFGGPPVSISGQTTIQLTGYLTSIKENNMDRNSCDDGYTNQATRYRESTQGADFLELRKAGLLNANGTLSTEGSRLLLELLLDKNKAKLVEAAKLLNKKD